MEDKAISRLTYHTLRWIYTHKREKQLLACNSPADIKNLINGVLFDLFEQPSESFIKGQKFIDFNALFEYVVYIRQKELSLQSDKQQKPTGGTVSRQTMEMTGGKEIPSTKTA